MSFHDATLQSKPTLESERTGRPGQGNLNDAKVLNDARREAGRLQVVAENNAFLGTNRQNIAAVRKERLKFAEITAPQLLLEKKVSVGAAGNPGEGVVNRRSRNSGGTSIPVFRGV